MAVENNVVASSEKRPVRPKMPLRQETLTKNFDPTFTQDREERTSFASFREERSDVAQSFLDSRTSSYAIYPEEAIDDSDLSGSNSPSSSTPSSGHPSPSLRPQMPTKMATTVAAPLTNPASQLHGFICPCDGFRGWKEIPVKGKPASRSFSDLRAFKAKDFNWDIPPMPARAPAQVRKPTAHPPGQSPLESLPIEILGAIIDFMVADIPPNGLQPRNMDLMSLLLASRALHSATLATLYKQVTVPHSTVFRKFLHHLKEYPSLGTIVKRLDFSHFNPTGSGITARQRAETQNLTKQTLLECLELLPNLREFLAQEHIDEELSADVIHKLFNLPQLRAVDFCAASSPHFRDAMLAVVNERDLPEYFSISRLSFHECTILPASVFEAILPRLSKLTHLDVAHTRISDKALASIPHTARLTHLNLSKCPNLSGEAVVNFLKFHPAAKDLVYLNLHMDAKTGVMLSALDLTELLPHLPTTLKSLHLKGSRMDVSHIPLLLPLTKHIEELGLGRNLKYAHVYSLLRGPPREDEKARKLWVPHTLRYIDISDMEVGDIDFGLLFGRTTTALDKSTLPLEVIEVSSKVYERFLDRERMFKNVGWVVKEAGRRGWLVRDMSDAKVKDDGSRNWKIGATYWGMRKIPVALAEVGGMYGLYMFKR